MVGNEIYARRKVLAGIVITFGNDIKTSKVIAVTTGTKCISGEYISVNGLAVNDSHAEIVARRCFVNFLYDQLDLHTKPETAKDSIFLKPTEKDGLYRLKDNIQIHLYINTAPCGDARVFSPHENDQALDKHPNRKARGQLRTKVESGEGTIPVKNCDGIQTWDGVLQVNLIWSVFIFRYFNIDFRVNVCSQCPVRIKLPAGMCWACKGLCFLRSFSRFICTRLCWDLCCIPITCIGKNCSKSARHFFFCL
jgi:hypothetical protein